MDANETITYWDKLRLRSIEVERTIKHLEKERQEVEENSEWMDSAAYKNRVSLLDGLITLYRNEMEHIEKAHSRVEEYSYGLCLACHEPIDADRLEFYPAAQFCIDCQDYRERLRTDSAALCPSAARAGAVLLSRLPESHPQKLFTSPSELLPR